MSKFSNIERGLRLIKKIVRFFNYRGRSHETGEGIIYKDIL